MNEEINEHHISFTIVPETYDYEDGEIIYRIFLETNQGKQLLIERALPQLIENQGLNEKLILKKISEKCRFTLFSVTEKKVIATECFFSNVGFKNKFFIKNAITNYGYVSFDMVPNHLPKKINNIN